MSRIARLLLPASALVATAFLLTDLAPGSPANAADGCLGAPNAPAPRGSHWYYRVERPSLRKCWRLVRKDVEQRASAAADPAAQPEPKPAEPAPLEPVQRPAIAEVQPVIRTLVTRNASNTNETALPPPPASSPARGIRVADAAAPVQDVARGDAPAIPADQPVPAPSASDQPVGLGLLFQAVALLGLLVGAAFGLMRILRRRADVLDMVGETADEAPAFSQAAPRTLPAAASEPATRWHPDRLDRDEPIVPRRRRART